MRNLGFGLLPAVLVLGISGCEGADGRPINVQGRALLDGMPLAEAKVTFIPKSPGWPTARGLTSFEGNFRLTTFKTDDGAIPGDYKVTVTGGKVGNREVVLPDAYSNVDTTPLEWHVPGRFKLVLELQSRLH